jgi:hypothetical protein
MPGETRLVACLWVIFVVRGLFYAAFIPLWEGFDEWAHYAVIQRLALGKQLLVTRGERVSREVDASLQMAPSIYGSLSRDTYWQFPESQRADYERNLRSIPVAWAGEPAIGGHPAYEGQQAPVDGWPALSYARLAPSILEPAGSFIGRSRILPAGSQNFRQRGARGGDRCAGCRDSPTHDDGHPHRQ